MKNQEVHKYLRKNKGPIPLSEIENPPEDYVRPKNYDALISHNEDNPDGEDNTVKYYRDLREEMSR